MKVSPPVKVLLQIAPEPGAGPVEQDPLVGLADVEDVTDIVGREPLDVAKGHDGPLTGRQIRDHLFDNPAGLGPQEQALRVIALPAPGRFRPPSAGAEPRGVHGRPGSVPHGVEIGEQNRTPVPDRPRLRPVGEDLVDPRGQCRPAFEAGQPAQDGHPRVLDDLLCGCRIGEELPGQPDQPAVILLDERLEGVLVAFEEERDELEVGVAAVFDRPLRARTSLAAGRASPPLHGLRPFVPAPHGHDA
jgi:hypothetical protein